MAEPNDPVTFAVPGHAAATRGPAGALSLPAGLRAGRLAGGVRVAVSRDASLTRLEAVPGSDVVVVSIDGGPDLVLHPHTARELLNAQQAPAGPSRGDHRGDVVVTPTLRWPAADTGEGATRSRLGDVLGGVLLKAVHVVREVVPDLVKDQIKGTAASGVAQVFAKKVDGQVTEGLYALRSDVLDLTGRTPVAPASAGAGTSLVFVHGTFSSTGGGFGRLWTESPGQMAKVFATYDQRVYGLDHATLCQSPIFNALTLARALPRSARLHLVTHSRGGLVAEVLGLACARRALDAGALEAFTPEQRDELAELVALVTANDLHVDRIVRVGAPIRGTLLASKRLDAYLSVLKWAMELAGWAIAAEVVDFLGAVAQERLNPDTLPGLAAQVPRSPLVQWLHADPTPIPGELRVVSGDVQGDSVLTWLKTLMADSFYWTDNDVVVQTRSMYGGARREKTAAFALDRGGKVLHTRYFARDRFAGPIFDAMLEAQPAAFRTIGPLSWAGTDSSGDRGRRPVPDGPRPLAVIVPGFGASRLAFGDELVWPAAMAAKTLERLAVGEAHAALTADAFVGDGFDELEARLAATHEVRRFPYDWRLSLLIEAARLARTLDAAIMACAPHPVRVVTHGSGALLLRAVQLEHPSTWKRLLDHPEARILLLAPPVDGTWLPMQVLSGDETFGGLLTAGAPPFREPDVRHVFGTMPGLLQLQAGLTDPRLGLGDLQTWRALAEQDAACDTQRQPWHALPEQAEQTAWAVPSRDALSAALAFRRALDVESRLAPDHAKKIAIVVGAGVATPDGLHDASPAGDGGPVPVRYAETTRGDGRVAVRRASWPGVTAYVVSADHAALPSLSEGIPAYLELLKGARTERLPRLVETADADVLVPRRVSRTQRPEMPGHPRDVVSIRRRGEDRSPQTRRAIRITVIHGDLMFVADPLMVGHYRSTKLTGTEKVLDRLIGGTMSRSLDLDVYPDRPSSYQIFRNTHVPGGDALRVPRPSAVVVVGLGEEGSLTAADLVMTVRRGVVAWAERVAEDPGAAATFDLAATLLGSGGKGMDVAQVAALLAEAVSEADRQLEKADLPRVGALKIIELYLDRATDAWHALTALAAVVPERYVVAPVIERGAAALRRESGTYYRGVDYDFVSIVTRPSDEGSEIAYTVDSRRARTDVARLVPQLPLLEQLLDASNTDPAPPQLGGTLFNLLVPIELEPFLGNSSDVVLELDKGTAAIPWELLDTASGTRGQASEPWSIRSKIVRKLRVDVAGPLRSTATAEDFVLVIGEPHCDPDRYVRLPGARREAAAVAATFEAAAGPKVVKVIAHDDDEVPGPDSVAVLSALFERQYRIIHIAGHGEPAITGTSDGGVVLSSQGKKKAETFLGPKEFNNIRTVPELVFVNCCHIGAQERLQLLAADSPKRHPYNRPTFAATLAQRLIEIGVKCVIVAGWAVDDHAARTFAETFYGELLAGHRFIDATATARKAAKALGGTTWAAFQCWGDPEWQYQGQTADAQGRTAAAGPARYATPASAEALVVALETLTTRAEFDPSQATAERRSAATSQVTALEHRFAATWGAIGRVAYAFGAVWAALGDRRKAIAWYERAIAANDGSAPVRAVEQLSNLRVRRAWDGVAGIDAARPSAAERARLASATTAMLQEIADLQRQQSLRQTMELSSLVGSAYKRVAMVAARARREAQEREAVTRMRDAYAEAVSLAKDSTEVFYPAWNQLVADALVLVAQGRRARLNRRLVKQYRDLLAVKHATDEDFWSAVAEPELDLVEAVAAGTLADAAGPAIDEFRRLATRVPARGHWSSVYENSRFVLDAYRRPRAGARRRSAATEAERAAALQVLTVLAELAGAPAPKG